MFHAVPVLWRLHMMHHADLDFDFTTGSRFHPIEIVISMLIKMAAVVLIGAPAVSVVIFEVLLNGAAMFNHSNLFVPVGFDRVLRLLVVTPDMPGRSFCLGFRDEQQFRIQFAVVGPTHGNLSGSAETRTRRDDNRAESVPGPLAGLPC